MLRKTLVNTLTDDNYEPFVVKTAVKSFSDDYLSSLIKGNIKLSKLGHGMKDEIILALCMKLAVHKTTLERAAYIHQLRNSLIKDNEPDLNDILAVLEQKQADDLAIFLIKQENNQHLQKVLVDENTAVNDKSAQECAKEVTDCEAGTSAVKEYVNDVKQLEAAKNQVDELTISSLIR